MVIRPGTHALTVRYWIKDYATNVEGAITKTYDSFKYEKNDYYDMTANINVTDYDGSKYYMWDAQNNFWNGCEWNSANPLQPVLANEPYSGIGEDNFFNNDRTAGVNAKYSCRMLPNVNQMAWYISNGDPRWDGEEIWTSMGHLHKGGMWLLKKLYIPQISEFKAPAPYNRDMRQDDFSLNKTVKQGTPTYKSSYFFLPALGYYAWNYFNDLGTSGHYWTSTGNAGDSNWAYYLTFNSSTITLTSDDSNAGRYVMTFQ